MPFALFLFVFPLATARGTDDFRVCQSLQLGRIDFPTSGLRQVQGDFLRGVAALHSFWYEEASEAFQSATKADPEFVMGYWGEAMTYNHPLWLQQDTEAARKALARVKDTTRLTARERAR